MYLLPKFPRHILLNLGCIINIIAAIGVIFLNKHIFIRWHIQTMTLTAIQMGFTSLGISLCWLLKMFTLKSTSLYHMLPIAIVFCGFIVFSNLSLEYNTIGTYQLFKGLATPVLVLISWLWYRIKYSKMVIASIATVIVGVYTHSVNDFKLTLLGTIIAMAGVLSAALYQLWIGVKLEQLDMNPQQLLFYQAPLSVILLLPCIIYFEKIPHYQSVQEQQMVVLTVIASSVIGFLLNVTTYWVIKHTSPLTYGMVGHLKTISILAGGYLLFRDNLNSKQISGIVLTMFGLFFYSFAKMKETPKLPTLQDDAQKIFDTATQTKS